jgi:hypothetical protein
MPYLILLDFIILGILRSSSLQMAMTSEGCMGSEELIDIPYIYIYIYARSRGVLFSWTKRYVVK